MIHSILKKSYFVKSIFGKVKKVPVKKGASQKNLYNRIFIARAAIFIVVEDISIPYQWESAANLAMQNDRPDWAKWLKTGRA